MAARILVVDDEHNIRMMIRLSLKQIGYTVGTAADGPEGLETFADGSGWDLVLLDQRMPGMEGLEVLREMRKRDPQARILMITAFGTIDLAVEAMKAGARDFLRKPFTLEMLRGAVSAGLNGMDPSTIAASLLDDSDLPTFTRATVNGFSLRSKPRTGQSLENGLLYSFYVGDPIGETRNCSVLLPEFFVKAVKDRIGRDWLPQKDRFWQALCEEVLANYLWQHAEFPPDCLSVTEMTTGLHRWIDAIVPLKGLT